jgi:inhibitor of Bruton tyrosine kinase
VRIEIMKIASRLEMKQLEVAARQMTPPKRTMTFDLEDALKDSDFFKSGDVNVQLEDGELQVHSVMMIRRCPFFHGLFQGRTGGMWVAGRREALGSSSGMIDVDLTNISIDTFKLVLGYIYADTGENIFENFTSEELNDNLAMEELLDLVIDVMSVANELMLDHLSTMCQRFVGRYGKYPYPCQRNSLKGSKSTYAMFAVF